MNNYKEAKKILLNHGIVAFPTETVMGLGVCFDDEIAYNKLNIIKGRAPNKPYSMMLGDINEIEKYAIVSDDAKKCINRFLPGSLTLLLRVKDNVPSWVTCGSNTIGIRVPSNKEALSLLKEIGEPLLVPSANKAGEKPALNDKEVKIIFKDEVDYIIEGHAIGGVATTVADFTCKDVKIIREGPITLLDIKKTIGEK